MLLTSLSLSVECSFNRFPPSNLKVAGLSMSVLSQPPAQPMLSLSVECTFDRFPSTNLKVAGLSLSVLPQPVLATMLSLSLVCNTSGFTEVIDLKKGMSMLMFRKDS